MATKRLPKKKAPENEMLLEKISQLEGSKKEAKFWKEQVDKLQAESVVLMKHAGLKRFLNATLVEPEPLVTDPAALKKKIGARLWKLVSSEHLDQKKLEGAMATGQVDPLIVASVSEVMHSQPYIRFGKGGS